MKIEALFVIPTSYLLREMKMIVRHLIVGLIVEQSHVRTQ